MDVVATVDTSKLETQIGCLREALIGSGQMGDAATIIEDESRKYAKQVINFIPPPGVRAASLQQGEMAVKRDLGQIFTPVNENFLTHVDSEFGASGIDAWFTHPDGRHYELKWNKIDVSGSGMPAFHRANQNRRGRTRKINKQVGTKWTAAYVVSFQAYNAYLKTILSHVGWKKASVGKFFKALGGRLPAWIDRHVSASASEMHNNIEDHDNPTITMIARAPGLLDDKRIFADAARARAQAVSRRLKLVLSNYSDKVKQGILIARAEHRDYGDDDL